MKKNFKIILGIILCILIAILGYCGYTKYNENQKILLSKTKTIHYEILDDSVISTTKLKAWVSNNEIKPGVHSTSDNKYDYILVSGGKETTNGYGIALEQVIGDLNKITVKYKVFTLVNKTNVQSKETYPHMILRLPKDNRAITGQVIK